MNLVKRFPLSAHSCNRFLVQFEVYFIVTVVINIVIFHQQCADIQELTRRYIDQDLGRIRRDPLPERRLHH